MISPGVETPCQSYHHLSSRLATLSLPEHSIHALSLLESSSTSLRQTSMPTVERRSLPQSLSVVASKGRRLFSRETAPNATQWSSTSPTPLRASALSLNEALEQCWSSASSPYCLSNQLRSPQPSAPASAHSWGKEFGRRRSSNTTATSASSADPTQEVPQRRRKSLFSKKPRTEHVSGALSQSDAPKLQSQFVDPFAREVQRGLIGSTSSKPTTGATAGTSDKGSRPSHRLSIQQQQQQQQKKKEALERISDLVCLSVDNQPRSRVGSASSPTFLSPSPTLCDNHFQQVEAPPSPTSPINSIDSTRSMVAFPMQARGGDNLRLAVANGVDGGDDRSSVVSHSLSTFSNKADSTLESQLDAYDLGEEHGDPREACWLTAPTQGLAMAQNHILLPSSMKRMPSRMIELDVSKRSSASLRAEVGHGMEGKPLSNRCSSTLQHPTHFWEECRPSLRPVPPLRPSRSPLRSRSLSLNAATVRKDRPPSPPPPLPSPPMPVSMPVSTASTIGLVGPCDLTPVHTPPPSRRPSGDQRRRDRCDSWASATSSSSLQGAPFHTPTFGSARWSTRPVS